jgi:hypothetical protein
MGIKDFKPSMNHRMLTMGGYDPKLRLVSPKISTTWPGNKMPSSPAEGTPMNRNTERKRISLIPKEKIDF